jgi:CHASE3 domain sensor protein
VKRPSRAARTVTASGPHIHESSRDPDLRLARRGRLASAGVVVVLLGVSGFAVWSSYATAAATRSASTANQLADDFARAQSSVAAEQSLAREYRLEPSPAVRASYDAAEEGFGTALADVKADGGAHEGALVAKLQAEQSVYLEAINRMFALVRVGDAAAVLKVDNGDVDPTFAPSRLQ